MLSTEKNVVARVMIKDPTVAYPEMLIVTALHLMILHKISGLPVIDHSGKLVGILTEGDLLRRKEIGTAKAPDWQAVFLSGKTAWKDKSAHATYVRDVMTAHVHTVQPNTPLSEVVSLMEKHRIRRLPVLRHNRLVGTVSRRDILNLLLQEMSSDSDLSDIEIRDLVEEKLALQPLHRQQDISISVEDGIVTFEGEMLDDRKWYALRVAVEDVPGVKGVQKNRINPGTSSLAAEKEIQPEFRALRELLQK